MYHKTKGGSSVTWIDGRIEGAVEGSCEGCCDGWAVGSVDGC